MDSFPDSKYRLVLDNNYARIGSSFALYLVFSALLSGLIGPILFYYIVFIFKGYYVFSAKFLLSLLGINNFILIPCFCALIFQARSFNPVSLCLLTGKKLIDNICRPQWSKRRFYYILFSLYGLFFLFLALSYICFTSSALYRLNFSYRPRTCAPLIRHPGEGRDPLPVDRPTGNTQ